MLGQRQGEATVLHRIVKEFRFSEGVIAAHAPMVAITAPRAKGELREQIFMDWVAANRNLLRCAFVALIAAICLG